MVKPRAKVVYGGSIIGTMTEEVARQQLDAVRKYKIDTIDSANRYPGSEDMLGKIGATKDFTIHTKAPALSPGAMTKQSVLDGMELSLKRLGVNSVEVYYLHVPSPTDPIEETLAAIRMLYAAGKFKRFGLSNYLAPEVQKIYDIQKSHNSVLPSVYQANYNAFARKSEEDLFPLLRSLGFSIFAYSTTAGGFLAKDVSVFTDESRKAEGGRFAMKELKEMYNSLYNKPSLIQGLKVWNEVAKEEDITNSQLAIRWVSYHSYLDGEKGDSVILGGKNVQQLEDCFQALEKGPLSERAVKKIEAIWQRITEDAPRDNWNS